jgi:hypothetical protein
LWLAWALTQPIGRDEHMYQAAAASDLRLYEEVAFFQPPYAAWAYAGWQRLVPGDHVLLGARLFKAVLAVVFAVVFYRVARRLGAPPLLAAVLVLLVANVELCLESMAVARNYDLAQLSILLPMLWLPLRPAGRGDRVRLVAAGCGAGMAVGFKLTYAAPALVLVLWPLLAPAAVASGRRGIVWTALGAAVGLVPLLVLAASTDLVAFRFNVLDYHLLNAQRLELEGEDLNLGARLDSARRLWRATDTAVVLVLVAIAVVLARWRGRPRSGMDWRLVTGMLLAGLAMAVLPRPVLPAYYQPLILGLLLAVALLAGSLDDRGRRWLAGVAVVAWLVAAVHNAPEHGRRLARSVDRDTWPAEQVHRAGLTLATATAGRPERPVVTLHALYALEAGRPLAREFTTGVFAWRLGVLLDPSSQRRFHLVTPATVDSLLGAVPPAAIVVEATGPWDAPLVDWARQHGYELAPLMAGTLAFLRPDDPDDPDDPDGTGDP